MSSAPGTLVLPDLLSICKWEAAFNPHHDEAAAASTKWMQSFGFQLEGKKLQFFLEGGGGLLCSYVYHYAGMEKLRTACDFVNLLFVIDEISDEQGGEDAYKTGKTVLNALRDPDFDDGSLLCKMTKEFRTRFVPHSRPYTLARFYKHTEDYTRGFSEEAELRERDVVLDLEAYMILRRKNSAVQYCFGLFGYLLDVDLPDAVFYHPIMYEMHLAAVDMICCANDLYSYNMEQEMGHLTNNILIVFQKRNNVDLQGAAGLIGVHFQELYDKFEASEARLPSFGEETDQTVAKYIMAMKSWVAGNLAWSFATSRYFGEDREKVKETLTVTLSPAKRWEMKQ